MADELHGRTRELDRLAARMRRLPAGLSIVTGAIGIGKSRFLGFSAGETAHGIVVGAGATIGETRHRLRTALGARRERGPLFIDDADVALAPADLRRMATELGMHHAVVVYRARPASSHADEITLGPLTRPAATKTLLDAAGLDATSLVPEDVAALSALVALSQGHPAALEQMAGWLVTQTPTHVLRHALATPLLMTPVALRSRLASASKTLPQPAMRALTRCAAMPGPFSWETAYRLLGERAAESYIARLVDEGWLVRSPAAHRPHFHVLYPLRAWLGLRENVRAARARLVAVYSSRAMAALEPGAFEKVARLAPERECILAAYEAARSAANDAELPLAALLASFGAHGDVDPAASATRLAATLERFPRATLTPRARIALGDACWYAGQQPRGLALHQEVARDAHAPSSARALAHVRVALTAPTDANATRHLDAAERILRRAPHEAMSVLALGARGYVARAQGDLEVALARFDEEVRRAGANDMHWLEALAESDAASCHQALGEHTLALARWRRAERSMGALSDWWRAVLVGYRGLYLWHLGRPDAAEPCFIEARSALAASPRFEWLFSEALIGARAELGRTGLAEEWDESDVPARDDLLAVVSSLTRWLVAHAAADDASRRRLSKNARALRESHAGDTREEIAPFVSAIERMLGGDAASVTIALEPRRAFIHRPPLPPVAITGASLVAMLGALAEAVPAALDPEALFRRVWKGDRFKMTTPQRHARVRKVVSLLRKSGLGTAIECSRGKYALAGSVRVDRVSRFP